VTPPACTCDAGFRWADDRWARQQAGITLDATEATADPVKWLKYRATLNTAVPCTDCAGPTRGGYVR
jgi:hypothetical protein